MQSESTLFQHTPHPHQPTNVNLLVAAERSLSGFNTKIAVFITKITSTMWAAYLFCMLAFVGLLGLLGLLNPFAFLLATWLSQQFLQLILLPVIMVGQGVLSRHAEAMAEEQFSTTEKSYHHLEEIIVHLDQQDRELVRQTAMLVKLLEAQNARTHVD